MDEHGTPAGQPSTQAALVTSSIMISTPAGSIACHQSDNTAMASGITASTSTSNTNFPCHLSTIAPELRNRIYEYALIENEPIHVTKATKQPPLLRTCKQIRSEALSMYYSDNTFELNDLYVDWRWHTRRIDAKYDLRVRTVNVINRQPNWRKGIARLQASKTKPLLQYSHVLESGSVTWHVRREAPRLVGIGAFETWGPKEEINTFKVNFNRYDAVNVHVKDLDGLQNEFKAIKYLEDLKYWNSIERSIMMLRTFTESWKY